VATEALKSAAKSAAGAVAGAAGSGAAGAGAAGAVAASVAVPSNDSVFGTATTGGTFAADDGLRAALMCNPPVRVEALEQELAVTSGRLSAGPGIN